MSYQSLRQSLRAGRTLSWGSPVIPDVRTGVFWAVSSVLPMALTLTFHDSGDPVLWRVFRPDLSAALATHEAWQGDGSVLWVASPTQVGLSLAVPGRDPVYYVFERTDVETFVRAAEAKVPESVGASVADVDAFLAEVLGPPPAQGTAGP